MADRSDNGAGAGKADGKTPSALVIPAQFPGRSGTDTVTEGETSLTALLAGGLRWLGELRDGLLVGASGLYLLGYVVRSFYAAHNNLGCPRWTPSTSWPASAPP